MKATLEKGPTERWIIGSNDVAAIIDNRSHGHRPKDAGANVILTNALDRCVAWSDDLAPSNYPATRVQHYRPATYCPGRTHESSQARSARNGVKKKRSVPEGQDDYVGAAFDSITEVSTPNTIFVD